MPGSGSGGGTGGVEGQRSVRIVFHARAGCPKKTLLVGWISAGRGQRAHLYRRVTRVWLDSADILDVWTCDDRQPCARSGLWPARARAFDVNFSPDYCNRPKSPRSARGECLLGGNRQCQFSGNARSHVVITRIAVRHDHHLAPRLVEQGSRRRQGRDPTMMTTNPPPSTSNLPRTTMGKTKSRRISQGRCRRFGDPTSAGCAPRRRDGGIGERRGGEGCDEEELEAEESPSHEGAMRAREEVSVVVQGVQRLSPREEAQTVQGVRWV